VFDVIRANVNEFLLWRVRWRLTAMWTDMPLLFVGAAVYALAAALRRLRPGWLAGSYLLGAAVSAVAIGKTGSNVNYLLELSAGLAFAAGLLLAWQPRRWSSIAVRPLLALQVGAMLLWSQRPYRDWLDNKVAERAEVEQMARVVDGASGPVLADEFMGLLPLAGRRIQLQPFELTQMAQAGLWDDEPLVSAIRAGQFSAILTEDSPLLEQRWTPRMLDAIRAEYQPVGRLARSVNYRPRN